METNSEDNYKISRPILLIEDNLMDVNLIRRTVKNKFPEVMFTVLNDGAKALEYIESKQTTQEHEFPLFVILDLRMPFIDGLEVLESAKKMESWKKIPFVIFSTSKQLCDVKKAMELGASSFIEKPIDFKEFSETVNQIIQYWSYNNISVLNAEEIK